MKKYTEPKMNITKFFASDSILLQTSGNYAALQLNHTLDSAGAEYQTQNMAGTTTIQATRNIIKLNR